MELAAPASAVASSTPCSNTNTDPTSNNIKQRSLSRRSFRLRCKSLNTLRLRRVFDLFDRNSDNIITADELSQALNLLGLDAEFSDLQSAINSFVQPGNPGLHFDDFVALHKSLDEALFNNNDNDTVDNQEESDLAEAFKVFDEDGDGYICAKELKAVLAKLGLINQATELDRVQQMILSVDSNHDGVIDFFEFKNMMRSTIMVPTS